MESAFLEPWSAATSHAAKFEDKLRREVPEGHPLYGCSLTAIALRTDSDDVLFRIDGGEPRYAMVHLIWRAEAEPRSKIHWPFEP